MGEVMNSSISSGKRPHLWIWAPQVTPWILGLERMAIASVSTLSGAPGDTKLF